MKPYSEYSAEELAMERLFIRWVRFPNDLPIQSFWENWLVQHPHMNETVHTARQLVEQASAWNSEDLSGEEAGSLWTKIRSSIERLPDVEPLDPSLRSIAANWYFFRWSAGVCATGLLIMLWYFLEPTPINNRLFEPLPIKTDSVQVDSSADSLRSTINLQKDLSNK
ncbi:hypothetical protein [Telluribacter sp.]|jgi:hypothetical protein|uniref:hypothetical protein n=1 Tax=Telluribacter sp. TaxID=1978767 RepID=UPI002E1364C8|nr:hypothetical protein [Telluribacter sp.]